jgi:plasmid maintenance system antidote protein VapI
MTNKKIVEKIMKEMTPEEIVENFVLPVKETKKQREEAAKAIAEARKQYRAQLTKKDYLKANLLQLRFQLQDYIKAETYDPNKRFGNFLKAYLLILNKKSTELASEINIHETLVSQLINNHRNPNEDIMVRLELHSNNNIPAHYWFMLVQKDRINQLKTDKELRKREKKFVTYKVKV